MSTNATTRSIELAQEFVETLKEVAATSDQTTDWRSRLAEKTIQQWQSRGREVLSIHPELVTVIRFSDSSTVAPEVFRALPYTNPMVVFPEPPSLSDRSDAEYTKLVGFVALGCIGGDVVSTHEDEAETLLCVSLIAVRSGKADHMRVQLIHIPLTGKPRSVEQFVDAALEDFKLVNTTKAAEGSIEKLCHLLVGTLMYLCSTTLEAERVPRKTVQRSLNPKLRKPLSVHRVGWKIGAALSRRRYEHNAAGTPGTGQAQGPQHRKAHFKTVWTGPGAKTPKTVMVSPYWTKKDQIGLDGVNTVRRVS